jgi:hypothetical protein
MAGGEVTWPFVASLFQQTLVASSFGIVPILALEHGDYAGCPVCIGSATMIVGPWISLGLSGLLRLARVPISQSSMHSALLIIFTGLSWWMIGSEMPTGIRLRRTLSAADRSVIAFMIATIAFQGYYLFF